MMACCASRAVTRWQLSMFALTESCAPRRSAKAPTPDVGSRSRAESPASHDYRALPLRPKRLRDLGRDPRETHSMHVLTVLQAWAPVCVLRARRVQGDAS